MTEEVHDWLIWSLARLREFRRILANDKAGTPEGVLGALTDGQMKVLECEIERLKSNLQPYEEYIDIKL